MTDNVFSETFKALRSGERNGINEELRRWMDDDFGTIVEYNLDSPIEPENQPKPVSKEEREQKELLDFLDSLICIIDRMSYNDHGPATDDYNKVRKYIIKMEREIKDRAMRSALLFPTPGNFLNSFIRISIASGYTKFILHLLL